MNSKADLKKKISEIQIIAFDFDDTLVDEKKFLYKKWNITLKKFNYLNKKLNFFFFLYYNFNNNKILDIVLKKLDIKLEYKIKILKTFRQTRIKEFQFKKTYKLIRLLKKKNIKVGIMTNGKKKYQEKRIKSLSFYNFLDFIYYGDKIQKPNKKFFFLNLELRKMKNKSNFLYVGNDFKNDIEPSKKINLNSVLINNVNYKGVCTFNSIESFYDFLKKYL